jgi:hypothetical protein
VRAPKTRGSPVDSERVSSWLERFDGYRVAITTTKIRTFLGNFTAGDVDLGARVLDAVMFLKAEDMEEALRGIVGQLPGWHRKQTQRQGKWRFVAFSTSAGESGDTMLHKCRTALGLTGRHCNELFIHKSDLLRERLELHDSVIFVDDFAGTGQQACDAWRELAELLPGNPKAFLLVVAAGERALTRIRGETGLRVLTAHVLRADDDIFSDKCRHFTSDEKDQLIAYCRKADRKSPRGFGDSGFVIVLAHKTPNNSIPILHANHDRWRGLFPRH